MDNSSDNTEYLPCLQGRCVHWQKGPRLTRTIQKKTQCQSGFLTKKLSHKTVQPLKHHIQREINNILAKAHPHCQYTSKTYLNIVTISPKTVTEHNKVNNNMSATTTARKGGVRFNVNRINAGQREIRTFVHRLNT